MGDSFLKIIVDKAKIVYYSLIQLIKVYVKDITIITGGRKNAKDQTI